MTNTAPVPTLGAFDDDELVTGEAVALSLPTAGLVPRVAGACIDALITVTGFVLLLIVTGSAAVRYTDTATSLGLLIIDLVAMVVGYPCAVEVLTRGQTVGMMAVGVRVVRDDGGPVGFRHTLARALVGFVEKWLFFGGPAILCALLAPRGKRLGDLAAGTYVVRERVGLHMPPPAAMPPVLAGWASTADIAPLPDSLALAARQFLSRATTLAPQARDSIGAELADEVLAYVAPPPPSGIHREYVLAAVIAERSRRDALTLRSRDRAVARALPPDPLSPNRVLAPMIPWQEALWAEPVPPGPTNPPPRTPGL